ncbi:MAG: hypothetical protein KOO63_06115 [Bacteroidales bacterium]|nr:hypothetical protein [Candidatus Latescibacterota bacterium]
MADAVNGGVEIVVYWLRYLTDEAYWTGVEFDPQLLFFGTVTTCSGDSFLNADLSGGLPAVFSSQPIFGGGHSSVGPDGNPVEGSVFYWAPSACGFVELNLYFNSPDITGDLDVNLADVSCFAQDYAGSYNYRSDFNYDGIINLADVSILSSSVGTSCP